MRPEQRSEQHDNEPGGSENHNPDGRISLAVTQSLQQELEAFGFSVLTSDPHWAAVVHGTDRD